MFAKRDKPRQFLKNWRPITLLNVLYKIISGCLSFRIKQVLDIIISNTQSGFIKGRYIGENTRFVYDLMSYTEIHEIPGLLVLIDFEKAFDSMSWSFIYKVLSYFGFGEYIIQWIKILNTNFRACILQSGFLSEQFDIQRGCRQGDPVAPYLFIICAEILSILIKQNNDIKGIFVHNKEHIISQYADDTLLALDGSPKSLFEALETIDFYSSFSGLKINTSKTKIVWIGSKKFSDQVFHHTRWKLDWGSTSFNLLGFQFSVELSEIVDINFGNQIPKIIALMEQWKRRILTPIGRVTVIKSLLIPKLNHLFISLPTPKKEIVAFICKAFFEFLWKSKTDKVKRSLITQDYLSGGMKMVDVRSFITSLKCTWIKRLTCSHKPWMDIFYALNGDDILQKLYDFGDSFVFDCLLKENNAFWKDVLIAWSCYMKSFTYSPHFKNKFHYIPVWYNSNIKVNNKPVFFKSWYEKGIKVVQDFFDDDCNLLDFGVLKNTYNLSDSCVMQYNSIVTAISKYLKSLLIDRSSFKRLPNPYVPLFFEPLISSEKCSKIFYNFLNKNEAIPTSISKWEAELRPYGVDTISVQDVFKICYKTTSDSSAQWLQFRILHRIVPVGKYLKKINIKTSDCCGFCMENVETIIHVFIACDKVQTLWSDLSLHIYRKTSERVGFNVSNVILGDLPLSNNNRVINFIILYVKQYIFISLMQNKMPNFLGLLSHLRIKYHVEKYAAIQNQKLRNFEKLWLTWKNILD